MIKLFSYFVHSTKVALFFFLLLGIGACDNNIQKPISKPSEIPQEDLNTYVYATTADSSQDFLTSFKVNPDTNDLESIGNIQSFPYSSGTSYGLKLAKPSFKKFILGLSTDNSISGQGGSLGNTVYLLTPDPSSGLLVTDDSKFITNSQGGLFAGIELVVTPSGEWGYLIGNGVIYGFGINTVEKLLIDTGISTKPGPYSTVDMTFSLDSKFAYAVDGLLLVNPDATTKSKLYIFSIDDTTGSLVPVDALAFSSALFFPRIIMAPDGNSVYVTDRKGSIQIFSRDTLNGKLSPTANTIDVPEVAYLVFHPTLSTAYAITAGFFNVSNSSVYSFNVDSENNDLIPLGTTLSISDIGFASAIVDPSGKSLFVVGSSVNTTLKQLYIQQQNGSVFNLTTVPTSGDYVRSVVSLQLPK